MRFIKSANVSCIGVERNAVAVDGYTGIVPIKKRLILKIADQPETCEVSI
jgi:hypothetical protein